MVEPGVAAQQRAPAAGAVAMEHVAGNHARLFDAAGNLLAEGDAGVSAAPNTFDVVAAEAAELMSYYFGRNGRAVIIEIGGLRREGRLDTTWDAGRRRWLVRINEKAATVQPRSTDPRTRILRTG